MPGTTSRLGLAKPIGSESMALGDNQLSDAWTKIDAAIGANNVATVAAVAAPFQGDIAFETTTLYGKMWNGAAWASLGSDETPKGAVDFSQDSTLFQSRTEIKIRDCVFNASVGRKYLVHYSGFVKFPSDYDNWQFMNFRWKNGTSTVIGDTLYESRRFQAISFTGLGNNIAGFFEFFPNVSAQVALGMWWDPNILPAFETATSKAQFCASSVDSNLEVMEDGI